MAIPLLAAPDFFYNTAKSTHTITAKNATPSINADAKIIFDRISELASGWRARASIADWPIREIP